MSDNNLSEQNNTSSTLSWGESTATPSNNTAGNTDNIVTGGGAGGQTSTTSASASNLVSRDGTPQPVVHSSSGGAGGGDQQNQQQQQHFLAPAPVAQQQANTARHNPLLRICAVLVDGFGFIKSCDDQWNMAPWDSLLNFIDSSLRARVAQQENVDESKVSVVFPEDGLHCFFPDATHLFERKAINQDQYVLQMMMNSNLQNEGKTQRGVQWKVTQSPLKQSNGVWQASVEDMKLMQKANEMAATGKFPPVGSSSGRQTATDIFIVTSDGDHTVTLADESAASSAALRWCVMFRPGAQKLRNWGNRTQRLLNFEFNSSSSSFSTGGSGGSTKNNNNIVRGNSGPRSNATSAAAAAGSSGQLQQQQQQQQRRQRDEKRQPGSGGGAGAASTSASAAAAASALGNNDAQPPEGVCLTQALTGFCPGGEQLATHFNSRRGNSSSSNNNNMPRAPRCSLLHKRPNEVCKNFLIRGECRDRCNLKHVGHYIGISSAVSRINGSSSSGGGGGTVSAPRTLADLDDLAVSALMDMFSCPPQVAQRELLVAQGNIQAAAKQLDALVSQHARSMNENRDRAGY